MATQDNVSYEWSKSLESSKVAEKPYLKKELLYVINQGGNDFSSNQVNFETTSLSNNGKFCDYRNGFISIPLVCSVKQNATAAGAAVKDMSAFEQLISFKSSNVNMIHSLSIDYNNTNVVQHNPNINALMVFNQHTTLGLNDIEINKHTGYYKHNSDKWKYVLGKGLINNTSADYESVFYKQADKSAILSSVDMQKKGENVFETSGANDEVQYYYYDCIIRLKDIPFFQKMPFVNGANLKINIILNQFDMTITRGAAGVVTAVSSTMKGNTCPIIRNEKELTADHIETISLKVVKNGAGNHNKTQCRLYVPTYTMNKVFEDTYYALKQKKVVYEDCYTQVIRGKQNFQELLTNSLARMTRLVIVPVLSGSNNGTLTINPLHSPFTQEPSYCSPYLLENFNVQISGSNIYQQNQEYSYEMYLNEMNGAYGVNANMVDGTSSSVISLRDYHNTYGYIVVDLSRRLPHDNNTPMSVQIQGKFANDKDYDLYCFICYEKDITLDLSTGGLVSN
jgi:hypothetical protein